jgi:hypothetical protein
VRRCLQDGEHFSSGASSAGHSDDREDSGYGIPGNNGVREKSLQLCAIVRTAPDLIDERQPIRELLQPLQRMVVLCIDAVGHQRSRHAIARGIERDRRGRGDDRRCVGVTCTR